MNRGTVIITCVLVGAATSISDCKVGPNYQAPATTMPTAFGELPVTQPAGAVKLTSDADGEIRWWWRLNDAKLTNWCEFAVAANPSVTQQSQNPLKKESKP